MSKVPDLVCPRCSCAVLIPGGDVVSVAADGKVRTRGKAVRCARCVLIFAAGDFGVIEPRKPEAVEAPPENHAGQRLKRMPEPAPYIVD